MKFIREADTKQLTTGLFKYRIINLQREPDVGWGSGETGESDVEQSSEEWGKLNKAKKRRQREQNGLKLPLCKVTCPEHKQQSRRGWQGSDHTEPQGLGKKVGVYPKSTEKSQRRNNLVTSRCSVHTQWRNVSKYQQMERATIWSWRTLEK